MAHGRFEKPQGNEVRGMRDNIVQLHPLYEDMKAFAARTGFQYCAIRLLCIRGQLPFVAVGKKRMIPVERGLQALKQMEGNNETE